MSWLFTHAMEGNTVNGLQWAYRSSEILYSRIRVLSMMKLPNTWDPLNQGQSRIRK